MPTRILQISLIAVFAASLFALWYFWDRQTYHLKIAAGQTTGEAFKLMKAVQDVANRYSQDIRIEVFETRGSLQNARLLERNRVDLATAGSDFVLGDHARVVVDLYSDVFQLLVHSDGAIKQIADLRGKRIALPPEKSAEYESFWFLANHYGLTKSDFIVYSGTDATTAWLFKNRDVDAVFRIRAPGDTSIDELVRDAGGQIIAIPQAQALQLKRPALEAGLIPRGSYKGWPSVPGEDILTVAVKRRLIARSDLPDTVVAKLTSVLFDRRRELIDQLPLAGTIARPDQSGGTFLPIHPGAQAFFERDEPSFLQENAEPIALLVSVMVVLMSAMFQLNAQRRRRILDAYNRELLDLAQKARKAQSFKAIDTCHTQLAEFVQRIISAAGEGRINAQEFNLFTFTYDAVEDAIRDREHQLNRRERENDTKKGGTKKEDSGLRVASRRAKSPDGGRSSARTRRRR